MSIYLLTLFSALLLGSVSQLLLKLAATELSALWALLPEWYLQEILLSELIRTFHTYAYSYLWLTIGFMAYALAMVAWVFTLQKIELSRAYPVLSLGYALVYIGAVLWPGLDEQFSLLKTAGVLLIITGISLTFCKDAMTTVKT